MISTKAAFTGNRHPSRLFHSFCCFTAQAPEAMTDGKRFTSECASCVFTHHCQRQQLMNIADYHQHRVYVALASPQTVSNDGASSCWHHRQYAPAVILNNRHGRLQTHLPPSMSRSRAHRIHDGSRKAVVSSAFPRQWDFSSEIELASVIWQWRGSGPNEQEQLARTKRRSRLTD